MSKKLFKGKNFYYKILLFLFIWFFFNNPINIHAAGSGGGNFEEASSISLVHIRDLQYTDSKDLVADSSTIGRFKFGETVDIVKYKSLYESLYGTITNANDFIDYCIEMGLEYGKDLICYPDACIFKEYNRNIGSGNITTTLRPESIRNCTGWLYLYCDSSRYEEWVKNFFVISGTDNFIPKLYQEDGTSAYTTIFPAVYFYAPISNIKRADGAYYSQIYNGTGSADDAIKAVFENGTQSLADFSGLNGRGNIGLGLGDTVLPGSEAWLLTLVTNGCNIENGYNNEGISYKTWNTYPLKWATVKAAANNYKDILNDYVDVARIKGSGDCMAFKTNTQTLGIDKMYGLGTSMKAAVNDWGKIVDVEYTIPKVIEFLSSLAGDELTHDSIGVYLAAKKETDVPADYIVTPSGSGIYRYLWAAKGGKAMAGDTNYFPRDGGGTWNVSDFPLVIKKDVYKTHKSLKNYADYGNKMYSTLDEADKIISVITIIQDNPALGAKLAAVAKRGNSANGTLADIVALNELGATNYDAWEKQVLKMGDILFSACSVNVCTSTGWSTVIGMARQPYPTITYNDLVIGISIVKDIPTTHDDLVVSNSYNTRDASFATDTLYDSAGRNVIDWMHGSNPGIIIPDAANTNTTGGRSSIPENLNSSTKLDVGSLWSRYDINCGIIFGGTVPVRLAKDNNNTIKIDANNQLAVAYDTNSESFNYNTILFLGRTPESSEDTTVMTDDIKIVALPTYNNYNVSNFDASYDVDYGARFSIAEACKDGSAAGAMSTYFSMFQSSYNSQVLFNTYKSGAVSYSDAFSVVCVPYAIQKMDKVSLAAYKKEDYPELGINAPGYSGLKPTSPYFTKIFPNQAEIEPGDVVAYHLAYKIPTSTTIRNEINKNSNTNMNARSLLMEGEWYTKYGAILMVDLDFVALPANDKADETWTTINSNTNNDWVRERIIPPVMRNIFLTSAKAQLDSTVVQSYSAGVQTTSDGLQYTSGRDSLRETNFKLDESLFLASNTGGTSAYSKSTASLIVNWRYFCRGVTVPSSDSGSYNYLDYSNGFTHSSSDDSNRVNSSKITGNITGSSLNISDMTIAAPIPKLSVNLNRDTLNSAKDKTISVSVPNNSHNQYTQDWEIASLTLDVPEKDNSVDDLVLVSGGADIGQGVKRGAGDNSVAQQLSNAYSGCRLYAVVHREAPSGKAWLETLKGSNSPISGNGPMKISYNLNGVDYLNQTATLYTGSIPNYTGKSIPDFKNVGDTLLFYINLPGQVKQLSATANFRNIDNGYYDYEDIAISNNSWSEIWETTSFPDYELSIIEGPANLQKSLTSDVCPPDEKYKAKLIFTVSQLNTNFQGGPTVGIRVSHSRAWAIENIYGDGYLGSGVCARAFGAGASGPYEYFVDYKEVNRPYSTGSSGNETFKITACINISGQTPYFDNTEINFSNNTKWAEYTINLNWRKITPQLTPYCIYGKLYNKDARTIKGLGQKYTWDTKFRWWQTCSTQTTAVNVYVTHYRCDCPSIYRQGPNDSKGRPTRILVQRIWHMHCPCYCSVSYSGPNNNVRLWRNQNLGLGLYYEYHDLRIYCWTSAKGLRDISGGSIRVETGEDFYFYFDAIYESNRSSLPRAKYTPQSQPYATGNGGSGCRQPCNVLGRTPNLRSVDGPRVVRITISSNPGSTYDNVYNYSSPQRVITGGAVNKRYRWQPVPDRIHVKLTNVNQDIHLNITSRDFKGYTYDTSDSVDGTGNSSPGYAWNNREKHVFCGSRSATIYIRPSKPYISSNTGTGGSGLDSTTPGDGSDGWIDGDSWIN